MDFQVVSYLLITYLCYTYINLSSRKLQEKGLSNLDITLNYRFLFFPLLISVFLLYEPHFLQIITSSLIAKLYLLYVFIIWPFWYVLHVYLLNSTSSFSYYSLLGEIIKIPTLFFLGFFVLGDFPSLLTLIGTIIIFFALILRPEQHKHNSRKLFNKSMFLIISLFIILKLIIAVDVTVYRMILKNQEIKFVLFFGALLLLSSVTTFQIISFFRKIPKKNKKILKENKISLILVALVFFISLFPEALSYSSAPAYVVGLVGSSMYLIQIFSDVKNKRLVMTKKTILYSILSFVGLFFIIIGL